MTEFCALSHVCSSAKAYRGFALGGRHLDPIAVVKAGISDRRPRAIIAGGLRSLTRLNVNRRKQDWL